MILNAASKYREVRGSGWSGCRNVTVRNGNVLFYGSDAFRRSIPDLLSFLALSASKYSVFHIQILLALHLHNVLLHGTFDRSSVVRETV